MLKDTNNAPWIQFPKHVTTCLFLGAILVAPWLFGSVLYLHQHWLAVTLTATLLLAWVCTDVDWRWPRGSNWLLAGVFLGCLQLVPLPPSLVQILSPATFELRTAANQALAAVAPEAQTDSAWFPITLYSAATRRQLALLIAAVLAYLLVGNIAREPRQRRRLLWLLAFNGTAFAIFGIIQQANWNGYLYWRVPMKHGGEPFAAYVNNNSGAGYLLMTLGCSVGLLSAQLPGPRRAAPSVTSLTGETAILATLIGMVVIQATAILCSLSRGATLAMVIAVVLVTLAELVCRRRGWLRPLCVAASVLLAAWLLSRLEMRTVVSNRIQTLSDRTLLAQEGRLRHWPSVLRAARSFPVFGSGLGTHRYVYRPFTTREDEGTWYEYAENQYLETAETAGMLGLVLLAGLIVLSLEIVWGRYHRPNEDNQIDSIALTAAGFFALSSQAAHAVFDFGLFLMANALTLAAIMGMLAGTAPSPRCGVALRARNAVFLFIVLLAGIWASWEFRNAAGAEYALSVSRFQSSPDPEQRNPRDDGPTVARTIAATALLPLDEPLLAAAVQRIRLARDQAPGDVELQYRLAECLIRWHRLRAYGRLSELPDLGRDKWARTSTILLHARCQQKLNEGASLSPLRKDPDSRRFLFPAWEALLDANRACCLHPRTALFLAELAPLVTTSSDNHALVEYAERLKPADSALLFRAGLLHLDAGRPAEGFDAWRRSLSLSDRFLPAVLAFLRDSQAGVDRYEFLLPNKASTLVRAARQSAMPDTVRNRLFARAERIVNARPTPDADDYYLRYQIHMGRGNRELGIQALAQAVALRPLSSDWHYQLGMLYFDAGQRGLALDAARKASELEPHNLRYRRTVKEIQRGTQDHEGRQ